MISSVVEQHAVVDHIYTMVSEIRPYDALEDEHIQDTVAWMKSGVQLFRIAKPDIPKKHLVSYFVLFDEKAQKILLVDHKKAQLWLPAGGHVEVVENPSETVRRECVEELSVEADFWCEKPVFLTSTVTVGLTAGHTDVSLWYVIHGDHTAQYTFDHGEFNAIKWFGFDEIPLEKSDPHMLRFINKLKEML
jgi:8-oxo-dGTP diphosphatase